MNDALGSDKLESGHIKIKIDMKFQMLGFSAEKFSKFSQERMEIVLTILSIHLFEESSFYTKTTKSSISKSKKFLEQKKIDNDCIAECKKKLRETLLD